MRDAGDIDGFCQSHVLLKTKFEISDFMQNPSISQPFLSIQEQLECILHLLTTVANCAALFIR